MPPLDWDAETYDRTSDPQHSWGLEVLDRLELRGDEAVMDAGCGTGRVTEALLARLPHGRVVAVDGSASMAELARRRLGPRADVIVCDLLELELAEPVDAVISTATFHWVPDHDRLFERLHAALVPGGQLAAQCGAQGNCARIFGPILERAMAEPPFAEHFADWGLPWRFPSPQEAEAALAGAGFQEISAWVQPRPMVPREPRGFVRSSCLPFHLERLPEELREPFLDRVMALMPDPPELDYVRLNIDARASGGADRSGTSP